MTHLLRLPVSALVVALAATVGAAACDAQPAAPPTSQQEAASGATVIDGQTARALVAEGALLLDVRTVQEFDSGHIDGAVNIPYDELPGRLDELGPSDAPVVVYCRSGRRSAIAASTLVDAGFAAVYDLGPITAW